MRGAIKRCISCVLPCGALDIVRVVHTDGRVEEIGGYGVQAWEIMQAHPKHVLRELATAHAEGRQSPRGPVVLPPTAELRRGRIYFLLPVTAPGPQKKAAAQAAATAKGNAEKSSKREQSTQRQRGGGGKEAERLLPPASSRSDRRRGRVGVWKPHLESISELPCDVHP